MNVRLLYLLAASCIAACDDSSLDLPIAPDPDAVTFVFKMHGDVSGVQDFRAVTSDADGRLEIREWPAGSPAILDLRVLSLLDSGSNSVLHTVLPK